jgi:hypothetical protein
MSSEGKQGVPISNMDFEKNIIRIPKKLLLLRSLYK